MQVLSTLSLTCERAARATRAPGEGAPSFSLLAFDSAQGRLRRGIGAERFSYPRAKPYSVILRVSRGESRLSEADKSSAVGNDPVIRKVISAWLSRITQDLQPLIEAVTF